MFAARPPAKVNLRLAVLGRRPDGFHDLRSTFVRVGVSDRLTMAPGTSTGDRLIVTGLPGTPIEGNLVLRALVALRAHAGIALPPLDVTLEKRIPAAAGLGGGSSDAAAALGLAQAAWAVSLSAPDLLELASRIGSDVPFFAAGCAAAEVTGRGESVEPIDPPVAALLLVTPRIELSTAAVFARHDDIGLPSGAEANDLWPAAASLAPSLDALRDRLQAATARPWLMSGSGPTLFAEYPSADEAAAVGQALVDDGVVSDTLIHAVDLVGPDPAWRYP